LGVIDLKPLGVIVAIVGGLAAVVCLLLGFVLDPTSAPQQAEQELRFVEAGLGALVFAIGIVIFQLEDGRVARRRDRGFDELPLYPDPKFSNATRICPHCTSRIRVEAKACRFCCRDVDPAGTTSTVGSRAPAPSDWGQAFEQTTRPPS
jgi:hypothetical protein